MDLDPMEAANEASANDASANEAERSAASRLSTWVAITVALLATFLGICKVKDDNIVQSMQQAQADKIDHWAFYQARNLREEVAKATLVQLTLAAAAAPAAAQVPYQQAITTYQKLVAEQGQKKEELRQLAGQDQATYDGLNYHDDQFDLSDTLVALAISMLALTALTHKKWLYWFALVPTAFGVVMGLAGLFSWHLHSGLLARWLS